MKAQVKKVKKKVLVESDTSSEDELLHSRYQMLIISMCFHLYFL